MHDSGLYIQNILTKREMINCQKFNFLLFLTINSVTTAVRELNGTSQISLVTHDAKGENARDLDEVSSGLARMLQHCFLYSYGLLVKEGIWGAYSHHVGGNRRRYQQSMNADQKSIETLLLVPFVASVATNGNRKLCF